MEIENEVLAPHTPEAIAKGCTCPDPDGDGPWPSVMLSCLGHLFDAACPLHGPAVRASVERILSGSKVQ